jgi:hypothetical protein
VSLYKKIICSSALIALVMVLGLTSNAEAQRRGGRVVVAPRVVVGGGYYYRPYFYDPFWYDPWYGFAGYQYPWGPYGYPPYRAYRVDPGASLRIEVKPKDAEVYVDGYYAGIVDDFDGALQHLDLEPGPHSIEIRTPGAPPISFDVNVQPGRTVTLRVR